VVDYHQIVADLKARHGIRVHRWRASMSGCAWRTEYIDGTVIRWVESPYPKSPLSLAIFLHEIGHHVIGFDTFRRRCEEELAAWDWAMKQMRLMGLADDPRVSRRYRLSMEYAVNKAMRRGIRSLPPALESFRRAA
jgi:hypothetical protein